MNSMVEWIARKRDGQQLSRGELQQLIAGYCEGVIPDYQMAAWAMAVYFQGMTTDETAALTAAMLHSGRVLQWPPGSPVCDKHSTGGVGDKVSLVLAPLLACCELRIPMVSGRGLGPTGGTLDKLESIPGFRTDLAAAELQQVVGEVGCAITGASAEIAPADRKLYALRDVTATVPSIPLITASILSKKLAEGLDALVLDVKWGNGAFMKDLSTARQLAESLTGTALGLGLSASVVLTDMNQPLGRMVGNTLEVDESVAALCGEGPRDLMEVIQALGTRLLCDAGRTRSVEEARDLLECELDSGRAYERFERMVQAQGGNLDAPRQRQASCEVAAPRKGYLQRIDCERLGLCVVALGGGRRVMSDKIDPGVGLEILVSVGDAIEQGQPLLRLYAASDSGSDVRQRLLQAFQIGDEPASVVPLIEYFPA